MKLTGAKAKAFLDHPTAEVQGALLFGPDQGLAREHAAALASKIADDPADPFRAVKVDPSTLKSEPSRLADERGAIAFGGGRRVITLLDATDGATSAIEHALEAAGDGFLVVVAGELGPRSKLRKLFEGAKNAVAIGCYADEARDLATVIRHTVANDGLSIAQDALSYLQSHLGSDRLTTRQELKKLVTFMANAQSKEIGLDDAIACVGDNAGLTLDGLVFAVAVGDQLAFDRCHNAASRSGTQSIAMIRATTRLFLRLLTCSGEMARGKSVRDAVGGLRPPVIFKDKPKMEQALRLWSLPRIEDVLENLLEMEESCKASGMPVETLCHRGLLQICLRARRGRRAA